MGAGGDVLFRLNRQTLPLHHEDGRRVDVLASPRRLKVGQTQDLPCWLLHGERDAIRRRLIGIRLGAAATRDAIREIALQANKKQKAVSK